MARRARPLRCWEPGQDQTPLPSWGCSVNSSPLGCGCGWAGAASPLQLFPCGSPVPAAQTASRGQPSGSFQQRYAALGHIRLCAGSSFFHSLLVPESFQDLCPPQHREECCFFSHCCGMDQGQCRTFPVLSGSFRVFPSLVLV